MILLGVSALHHDAAAAVVDTDGPEILFAAHSERYSRVKNDPRLCRELVDDVKRFGPERIVWYERPALKRARRALNFDWSFVGEETPRRHLRRLGLDLPIEYVDHHRAHAAAGAYTSPFDRAAVLVMDAIGEFETTTIWTLSGDRLEKRFSRSYPQSVGLFYSAFTGEIGLKPNEEEYILMAMSAFGGDAAYGAIRDDAVDLDASFPILKRSYHQGVGNPALRRYAREEIARGTQMVYEAIFDRALAFTRQLTGMENLVLMGGCALNCLANRLIRRHFKSFWIMPNPGDAGSSVGAALASLGRRVPWRGPYLGADIGGDYPVDEAMRALLGGGCIGVASGRAEFGPRALGNRSLLADPRGERTKDNVNLVKQREPFRPFAPVVLEERFADLFEAEGDTASPYMQCVYKIKQPDRFPAVTHVDGTSRVQTVNRAQHPGLYELLRRFDAETGCPMLLNTSLNVKGMPLANREPDARLFRERYGVAVCGGAAIGPATATG